MTALLLLLAALVLPPCPTEDSDGCYWNAGVAGNGLGRSFVAVAGTVLYLN